MANSQVRSAAVSRPVPALIAAAIGVWCVASRPAHAVCQAFDTSPFERLGARLIELADERAGAQAASSDQSMQRLAPLHERLRIGAYHLWAPLQVIDGKGRPGPAAKVKDLAPRGLKLLELQSYWLERASSDADEVRGSREAVQTLERWVKGLKSLPQPTPPENVSLAHSALEAHFGLPMRNGRHLTLIHAPTRAQYIGVVGARAVLTETLRSDMWNAVNATAPYTGLQDWSTVCATSWASSSTGSGLLVDDLMKASELNEWFAHAAAHQIVYWLLPMAPGWLAEALAIDSTIALCGADETLCSGWREADSFPAWWLAGVGSLAFVAREKSPYRGGPSAQRFVKPLRAAASANGWRIRDLERDQAGPLVVELLLGPTASTPTEIANATLGVRKGYAEFFRAYCTAFVGYLEQVEPEKFRNVLQELRQTPIEGRPRESAFHRLVKSHTGLSVGEQDDPATDLEARFRAWLRE